MPRFFCCTTGCWISVFLVPLTAICGELRLREDSATISVLDSDATILSYNKTAPRLPEGVDPVYRRSGFLHPVKTPAGATVTGLYPGDHRHQNGVFTAWVRTTWNGRKVDFWNIAGRTGRVRHDRVVQTFAEETHAGFEIDLVHEAVAAPATDVLRERWKVTVHQTDGTYRCFDLEIQQTALTEHPLLVEEYHYGGVAVRGSSNWLLSNTAEADAAAGRPNGWITNDRGSDRKEGNQQKTRWVTLGGEAETGTAALTVMSHPQNFRAAQPARLHPTKPYFCFAPCVEGSFVIDSEHPFAGRYRYLVTDERPGAGWLEEQWAAWTAAEESSAH